jgi:thioredoxin 2
MRAIAVACEHCRGANLVPVAAECGPRCGYCHKPLPWIVDAGDADFTEIAKKPSMPVLVHIWAEWSGPCRQVNPILVRLARERAGMVKLVRVNIDNAPRLSQRYVVQAVPTRIVLRGGEVVARQTGAAPSTVIREWLDQAISSSQVSSAEAMK